MNTIVIAAIALTVLIVLIYIFTGRSRLFVSGSRNCESQKGDCMDECLEGQINIPGTNCEDYEQKCCVQMIDTGGE